MLEYSNTFSFLAPSECNQYKILNDSDRRSVLVAVTENVIEIWQKTGTDSRQGLEQA